MSVFYGDIFMYLPAVMRGVGFTLEEAYKAYMGIINIATVFVSFYSFKRMTRNAYAAMIGSVLYAGSIQRLDVLYNAHIGAAGGMVFLPLIIAGFYLLFTVDVEAGEYKSIWMLLTCGFTGLLMTHMLSCLIVGIYAFFLCLVMCRKVLRPRTLRELLKAVGVAVLLNLWYLVPFMQYMFGEKLKINKTAVGAGISDYYARLADFTQEGKNFYQLFTDENGIGFPLLAVLLLYAVTMPAHSRNKVTKYSRIVAVITLAAYAVCTSMFPVVGIARHSALFTRLLIMIQYQQRLMNVATALAACLAALFFAMEFFDKKALYAVGGLLCCGILYGNLQYFSTVPADAVYLDGIELDAKGGEGVYKYNVGNGEYLPVVTVLGELTDQIEGDGYLSVGDVTREGLVFDISVKNESHEEGRLLLPVLYYSGYRAEDLHSLVRLETDIGDNGRVEVTIPPRYEGTFHLEFRESLLWRVSEVVSAVTLIGIMFNAFKRKREACILQK